MSEDAAPSLRASIRHWLRACSPAQFGLTAWAIFSACLVIMILLSEFGPWVPWWAFAIGGLVPGWAALLTLAVCS